MVKAFVFCALVAAVAADCQTSAFAALSNPNFNWLVQSPPADQKTKLTAICDPSDTTSRNSFNAVLADLQANCVASVNGSTSPTALVFEVLQGILCKSIDGQLCGLGVFAMFDLGYFTQIQTAASQNPPVPPPLPDLTNLMTQPDRAAAMCASDVCNAAIEQYTSSSTRAALESADASGKASTQAAVTFVTKLVNRMRCACFTNAGSTCYTQANVNAMVDTTSLKSAACDTDGNVLPCGRTFMTCEQIAAPTCPATPPCNGYQVTFDFDIKNLDKACYFSTMTAPGSALGTIGLDLAINLLGTIKTDYSCDCPQTNADRWVHCSCTVKCATFGMFNENQILAKVKAYSDKFVANSNNLDLAVNSSCKVNAGVSTYGESTVFHVTIVPQGGSAAALGVCTPLFVALFALLL